MIKPDDASSFLDNLSDKRQIFDLALSAAGTVVEENEGGGHHPEIAFDTLKKLHALLADHYANEEPNVNLDFVLGFPGMIVHFHLQAFPLFMSDDDDDDDEE